MLKNLFSASGLSLIRAAVQLFMTLILTRFIDSSSYGVMAFAIPVWTFITLMSEMGLGNAIVRSEKLTAAEAGAAFKISLFSGIAGALLMVLAAYPASRMLGDPRIGGVLLAFSVILLVAMLSTAPRAMLERELRYSTIAIIEVSATLIAVPVCIVLAITNFGVWSLVAYHFVVQVIRFVSFMYVSGRLLDMSASWRAGKLLLAFGGWILAFNVQNFLARNADNLLIGAYIGTNALGVYALSYQVMTLPLLVITWPASNVLLATLSKSRRQSENLSKQYTKALCALTATLIFPFASYLVVGVGYPAHAFMGPSWQQVPDVLLWLAPVGAIQSIASYSGAVLTATGKVRLYFFFGVVNTVLYIAVFALAVHYGLQVFVISYFACATFLALGHIYFIIKSLSWSFLDFLDALVAGVIAAAVGAGGYLLAGYIPYENPLLQWCTQTVIFLLCILVTFYLFRARIISEARFLAAHREKKDDASDHAGIAAETQLAPDESLAHAIPPERKSAVKALLFDPGYLTVKLHFAAQRQRAKRRNFFADILWRINVFTSSCHIHYDAQIGRGLFLPHPTGIVIGSGSVIKDNVTIYQGTTLGRRSATAPEYPTIENDVTIFPNSTIVGGITVGAGATIGANSFVNSNVEAGDYVAGSPARSIRRAKTEPASSIEQVSLSST